MPQYGHHDHDPPRKSLFHTPGHFQAHTLVVQQFVMKRGSGSAMQKPGKQCPDQKPQSAITKQRSTTSKASAKRTNSASSTKPSPTSSIAQQLAEYRDRHNNKASSGAEPQSAKAETPDQGVWRLKHETGYIPDGFHSPEEPERNNLGVFSTRTAAIRKGKSVVGSDLDYSWKQVEKTGDLEIVADTSTRWEACWSPPDSEYSRVTVSYVSTITGRWIVDVVRAHPGDRFHSYSEPENKSLGPFSSREQAVAAAKNEIGAEVGWVWDDVAKDNDFKIREDSSHRWEAYWDPPDTEHTQVVALLLPFPAPSDENDAEDDGDSSNDDESDDDDDVADPLPAYGARML